MINPVRRAYIIDRARQIKEKYPTSSYADLEQVALDYVGVAGVIRSHLPPTSCAIRGTNGRDYIFVHSHSIFTARITLAHEIGHVDLGHTADKRLPNREAEADFYAYMLTDSSPIEYATRMVANVPLLMVGMPFVIAQELSRQKERERVIAAGFGPALQKSPSFFGKSALQDAL